MTTPTANPIPAGPRLSIVREIPEKHLRILLVDSNDGESLELRRAFEACTIAQLEHARDAETASSMVASERFDLVAVYPVLPDGFALLKEIKNKYRWIASLVVSRDQSPSFPRHSVKCRIDGLLFKAVAPAEFIDQALLLANAVSTRRQRQQKRVLVIGAHPNDVEIGCGGAMAKHHAAGDLLYILTLFSGAAGCDANTRTAEANRAAALFGAQLEMGSLRDTYIADGRETIGIIQAAICEFGPTHVYTHCAGDTHQDHRAVQASWRRVAFPTSIATRRRPQP